MRRWRIDAIRDDMSPFPGLSVLAPFLGKKAIVVVHNLFGGLAGWRRFYSLPFAIAGAVGEFLLLHGLLRYRAVATAAPWLAAYVRDHGGLRIEVALGPQRHRPGVDPATPAERPDRADRHLRPLQRAQGAPRLVAAAATLRERGHAFHLTLIGGGPLEGDVRRTDCLGSGSADHVTVSPTLPRAELLRQVVEHDLFVLASSSEGLPLALLEAMAAGLPAVVADRPYVQGLVTGAEARLFDPDEPEALADAIAADLMDPAGAEARAVRARALVETYSWDRAAAAELRLLESVAS